MKRLKFVALLLSAGAILFINLMCSKEETPTSTSSTATANVICPLKVGNYWVYADSFADTNGVFIWGDSSKVGLGGSVNIPYNGTNYLAYLWSWYDVPETLSATQEGCLVINMSDGVHNIGLNDTVLFNVLWAKYPCSVGNSWTSYGEIQYNPSDSSYNLYADTTVYECVSQNQQITCGIGTISCYVYRFHINYKSIVKNKNNDYWGLFNAISNKRQYYPKFTVECDLYFAPNIGYLGFLMKENGVAFYKLTLKRYHKN